MELFLKSLCQRFVVVFVVSISLCTTSFANIIRVTTENPTGPGSISEAITLANADSFKDTILFDIRNSINLMSTLTISNPVVIICYGKSNVVLNASATGTVFSIDPSCNGDVWMEGLNFSTSSTSGNGTIHVSGNNQPMFRLIVYDCIFEYCRATNGGAVNFNGTNLIVHSSSFTDCSAVNNGGSIFVNTTGGTSSIIFNSTFGRRNAFSAYDEAQNGGGIYIQAGPVKVVNNTFARLEVTGQGGGLYANTTNYELKNNIFYQNLPGTQFRDIAGSMPVQRGYNCFQQTPVGYTNGPGDINGGAWGTWVSNNNSLYLSPLSKGHSGLLTDEMAPIIDNGDNINIVSDYYWSLGLEARDIRTAHRIMQGTFYSNVTIDRGSVEFSPFCVTNANASGAGSLTNIVDSLNTTVRPGPFYIWFDIVASGPHLVNSQPTLQLTKNNTIIDGFSSRGAREASRYDEPEIMFQISGNNAQTIGLELAGLNQEISGLKISNYTVHGINVNAGATDCRITGNVISNGTGDGIRINGEGTRVGGAKYNERNYIHNNVSNGVHISSNYNRVQGNYIGIRPDLSAGGNGGGVLVDNGSYNEIGSINPFGGNFISANTSFGIKTESANTFYNTVRNNVLGCRPNLASHSGYANGIGIHLNDSYYNYIGYEMYPLGGNVIVSSVNQGILISNSEGQDVFGNIIGLYPNGVTNGAVGGAGVEISGFTDYNSIGSNWNGDQGNVISNCEYGVYSHATTGFSNSIVSNKIGSDISGSIQKGNQKSGIYLVGAFNGSSQAEIYENLIVGHQNLGFGYGIHSENASVSAYNNLIGLDSSDNAMPNRVGVFIEGAQTGYSSIGNNTIAYSQGLGIWVKNSRDISINSSIIHNSGQEGVYIEDNSTLLFLNLNTVIDNVSTGIKVTNDCDSLVFRENIVHSNGSSMDYDLGNTGPEGYTMNEGIPPANLTSAVYCGTEISISGNFLFPAYPDSQILIDFYLVPNGQANGSNRGGSHVYLANANEILDASGGINFSFQSDQTLSPGDMITAVVSLYDPLWGEGLIYSSEFSENITVTSGISVSVSHSNASCADLFDGSASATVDGSANTPKWFEISDLVNSIWVDFSVFNLGPGDYAVVIEDGSCSDTAFFTVTAPAPLSIGSVITTDVVCAGTMTGEIQLMGANGGAFPFEYSLNGGPSSPSTIFPGLTAGAYSVEVIDANGCTDVTSVNITEPTFLSATFSPTDLSCFGSNDGAIMSSVFGGVPPYTYSWSNGATTQNVFGLAAGSYSVDIYDANGCTINGNTTVTEPTVIVVSTSSTPSTCGNADGQACATVSGGTGPYTQTWSPGGQTTLCASNIVAGTYTITVEDEFGCVQTATANVTDAGSPTATITASSNVSCFGGANGSATVSAAGGTAPYTYLWSGGTTPTAATTNGLTAGTASVVVTDLNGCQADASLVITEPSLLSIGAVITTDVLCAGSMTGIIELMGANGGTFPFEYSLDGAPSSPSTIFTGLTAGAFSVEVIDANGCTDVTSVNITEPTFLSATFSPTDLSCFGSNDGAIMSSVFGGVPPYTYSWSNGATTQNVFGLAAGSYSVDIYDANGCQYSDNIIINQPAQNNVLFTSSNSSPCAGESVMFINASDPGATAFFWDFDNGDPANNTLENTSTVFLAAGTYNVKLVVTYNLCSDSTSQLITVNPMPFLTGPNSIQICSGESVNTTFEADLPSTFSWYAIDNTGVVGETMSIQNTATNNDVLDNTSGSPEMVEYIVTSSTAQCSNSGQSFFVWVYPNPTITVTNNAAICEGSSIGLLASGAVNYLWTPALGLSNASISNPIASPTETTSYVVSGEDGNGCSNTNSVIITVNPLPVVTASNNGPLCEGEDLNLFGSFVAGAIYSWFGPSYDANTQNATLLNASPTNSGTYTLFVVDGNGCENSVNTNVTVNSTPVVTASFFGPICEGTLMQLEAIEGGLSYSWTGPNGFSSTDQYPVVSGSADISLIGSYNLVASDGTCANSSSVFVEVNELPSQLTSPTSNDADCGIDNGSLIGFEASGIPDFMYEWYDVSMNLIDMGADLINVSVGDYTVVVSDGGGCQNSFGPFTINNPNAPLPPDLSGNPIQGCEGEFITFTATSPSPSPTFSWSGPNGNNGADANLEITSLTLADAGTYSVTVTSASCVSAPATFVFTVNSPISPTFSYGTFLEMCEGDVAPSLEIISAENINGTWTPSVVSNTVSDTYVFTPNVNECAFSILFEVVINSPIIPTFSFGSSETICYGSTGQNLVNTSLENINGVWSPTVINDQASGTYTFMPNVSECANQTTFSVTVLDPIVLNVTGTQPSCQGDADGEINVLIQSGGNAPFFFSIDGGATNQMTGIFSGLVASSYSVLVEDESGCTVTELFSLTDPSPFTLVTSATEPSCFGNANGEFSFGYSGGTSSTFTYQIDGGSVTSLATNPTVVSGFEGGVFISVTLTNEFGCSEIGSHTFTDPSPLTYTLNSIDDSCNLGVGTIQVTNVVGGSAPYTYLLNGVSYTNPTIASIAGLQSVTVEDANGCQISQDVTVANVDVPIVLSFEGPYTTCPDEPIEISVIGGQEFFWYGPSITDNTLPNPTVNPLVDSWYQVVVGVGSCTGVDSVLVTIDIACNTINEVITTNAFSPDGDGVNDNLVFDIGSLLSSHSNNVIIVNRWGDIVREFVNYNNIDVVWDGSSSNGVMLPPGTYFYIIEIPEIDYRTSGWIQLIR
jgi:gliding motility-associated-like protein